jgi:hypothetical protein
MSPILLHISPTLSIVCLAYAAVMLGSVKFCLTGDKEVSLQIRLSSYMALKPFTTCNCHNVQGSIKFLSIVFLFHIQNRCVCIKNICIWVLTEHFMWLCSHNLTEPIVLSSFNTDLPNMPLSRMLTHPLDEGLP